MQFKRTNAHQSGTKGKKQKDTVQLNKMLLQHLVCDQMFVFCFVEQVLDPLMI